MAKDATQIAKTAAPKSRKRRGKGEGSIHRRQDGLWQGAVSTSEGRKFVWAKTEADCIAAVRKMQHNVEQGLPAVPDKQTVAQFLTGWPSGAPPQGQEMGGWLGEVARPHTRPRVYQRYEQIVRLHILPDLGRIQLARLRPLDIQRLYNAKLATLSAGTIKHIHEVLHNALQVALEWGLVVRNVSEAARLPRSEQEELRPLDQQQARILVRALKGDPWEALYILAITAGLRQSELLGLKWVDLDLEKCELRVRRNVQRVPGIGFVEDQPKSKAGRRGIALTSVAVAALHRHRKRQIETRLAAGPYWQDLDLVFPNSVGRPVEAGNLTRRYYKPMLKRAGLPDLRFHGLRHSAASLLIALGADDKVVQQIMGHSDSSMTMNVYAHALPESHHAAIARLGRLLDISQPD